MGTAGKVNGHTLQGASSPAALHATLMLLLDLQSVLSRLQIRSIREEFLAQKIIQTDGDPSFILAWFDTLYQILTPDWHNDSIRREENYTAVCHHLNCLTALSEELFEIPGLQEDGERYSYATWMHALQKLMGSKF